MTPITRFNIIATSLAGLCLALSISYFFIFLPYHEYSRRASQLKEQFIAEEKKVIRMEIQRALNELDFLYRNHLEEVTALLSLNLAETKSLIESERYSNLDQVHKAIADMRRDMSQLHRYAHFIFDSDQRLISYSNHAQFLALGMKSDLTDNEIESLINPLWGTEPNKLARIIWPSTDKSKNLDLHAIYAPLKSKGLRIVTVVPHNISDKYLQKPLMQHLSQIRFGTDSSGYLFIINSQGRPIMVPTMNPAFNPDLSPLQTKDDYLQLARKLVSIARDGGGIP